VNIVKSNLKYGITSARSKNLNKTQKFHIFDGNYLYGKASGHGTMKYANGDVYKGYWLNGLRHGSGILKLTNGDLYTVILKLTLRVTGSTPRPKVRA